MEHLIDFDLYIKISYSRLVRTLFNDYIYIYYILVYYSCYAQNNYLYSFKILNYLEMSKKKIFIETIFLIHM